MARVSRLGIVFDASGAKKGAAEAEAALKGVGATAQRTGAAVDQAAKQTVQGAQAVTRATEEQIKAIERAQASAAKRANEERRAATQAAERAAAELQAAQKAAEAFKREADAAQATAMKMAALHQQALNMDAAMTKAAVGFGLGDDAANRLRGSLTGLLVPMLQTTGSANVLASTIGSLAIGNAATVGILAGLAAIGGAYEVLTAQADAARKKAQDAFQALDALRRKERQGNLGDTPQQIIEQTRVVLDAQRKLQQARQELANAQNSLDATAAKTGVNGRASLAAEDLARLQQQINASKAVIDAGNREINRLTAEANADFSRLQTERLATLVRGNAATVAEQAQLRDRLRNLQAELNTLTVSGGNANRRSALIAEIQTITSVYESQAKAAERTADADSKAAAATVTFAQRYAASLNDVQQKLREYDEAEARKKERLDEANAAIQRTISARALDIDTMRGQLAAVRENIDAYSALAIAREQERAVAAARASLPKGAELDPNTAQEIRRQVEEYLRLKQVLDAFNGLNVPLSDLFKLPVAEAKDFTAALQSVVSVAQQIGQIFGQVGSELARAVQLGAQLVMSMQAAARASQAAEQARGTAREASTASAARGANLAAGASFLTASITAVNLFASASRRAAEEADRMATALREQRLAALNAADAFLKQGNTGLTRELDDLKGRFDGVITQLLAAGAPSVPRLGNRTARSVVPTADTVNAIIDKYEELKRIAEETAAFQLAQAKGDLDARLLSAQGRTAEADALRLQLAQAKELRDAEAQFEGNSAYLEHLKTVQAAEMAAAQAAEARRQIEQQQQRTAFGLDLTQRRQTLSGDSRGAFITGQTIQSNSALAEAQKLVEAGTITAAMFEDLKKLIGDEMAQALRDFDAAAAESVRQQREDIAVRALVAQGKTAEAEQLRIDIANRRELQGVTDEATRAEILRVQALEEGARLAETLARTQDTLNDLRVRELVATGRSAEAEQMRTQIANANELKGVTDAALIAQIQYIQGLEAVARATQAAAEKQAMLDDLRVRELAATGKTREADLLRKEIEYARELAGVTDDAVRKQMEYVQGLERLTEAMEYQKRKAEELADFSRSINGQYLRATGRGFDADVADLQEWRREQRKRAEEVGAGADVFAQIEAIYNARYGGLIADRMKTDTPSFAVAAEPNTVLGEETTAVRSARSVSEATALQLVDYSASQLAVQREILAELRGKNNATRERDPMMRTPILDYVDNELGTRFRYASQLLAGRVR